VKAAVTPAGYAQPSIAISTRVTGTITAINLLNGNVGVGAGSDVRTDAHLCAAGQDKQKDVEAHK
jgi:hypothetical protein